MEAGSQAVNDDLGPAVAGRWHRQPRWCDERDTHDEPRPRQWPRCDDARVGPIAPVGTTAALRSSGPWRRILWIRHWTWRATPGVEPVSDGSRDGSRLARPAASGDHVPRWQAYRAM